MAAIRWTAHALQNLADRGIDRDEADKTFGWPEYVVLDPPRRRILMRRYYDAVLQREMLMRIVIEERIDETIVVTVYKSSQLRRYLKGLTL